MLYLTSFIAVGMLDIESGTSAELSIRDISIDAAKKLLKETPYWESAIKHKDLPALIKEKIGIDVKKNWPNIRLKPHDKLIVAQQTPVGFRWALVEVLPND